MPDLGVIGLPVPIGPLKEANYSMFRFPANVWCLVCAGPLVTSSVTMMVFIAGLMGHYLAPNPTLATMPLSFLILGTVTATIPTTMLMSKLGRKSVYLLGCSLGLTGSGLGFLAVYFHSFTLLVTSAMVLGANVAVVQQYRFGLIESLEDPSQPGYALSLLMMGGVIAAWIGPELGTLGLGLFPEIGNYAGSFVLLALLQLIGLLVLTHFKNPTAPIPLEEVESSGRELGDILSTRAFWIAAGASSIGYSVMAFLMTATPIAMHNVHHYSLEDTKVVIQSHIVAMFLPSLFAGWLMQKLGMAKLLLLGNLALLASFAVAFTNSAYMHYWWALVLLGVGWNFLFMGGTALLQQAHDHNERFKTQATNEFMVFGMQALASFSAGWMLFALGWNFMIIICLPASITMFVLIYWQWQKEQLKKTSPLLNKPLTLRGKEL